MCLVDAPNVRKCNNECHAFRMDYIQKHSYVLCVLLPMMMTVITHAILAFTSQLCFSVKRNSIVRFLVLRTIESALHFTTADNAFETFANYIKCSNSV